MRGDRRSEVGDQRSAVVDQKFVLDPLSLWERVGRGIGYRAATATLLPRPFSQREKGDIKPTSA